ncbi:MAG: hypothetical protein ACI86C_001698 [Candidatus Latescibacterota bacterium]
MVKPEKYNWFIYLDVMTVWKLLVSGRVRTYRYLWNLALRSRLGIKVWSLQCGGSSNYTFV